MKEKCAEAMPTSSVKTSRSPKLSPVTARTKKTVKFVTSPMWKSRGSIAGGGGRRSVLRVLPANARNSRLLVGAGSPRLPSFGKNTKSARTQEVSAMDKENHVAVKQQAVPVFVSKAIQTEEVREAEPQPSTTNPMASMTSAGSSLGDVVSLEDYWRELAEQRRAALADTLMENEELHTEIVLLRCKVKELETAARDADYFAMMYHVSTCTADTADSSEEAKEATVAAKH